MDQANLLKEVGNACLSAEKYEEAIDAYTKAIAHDEKNHVLYSNRSAAYCKANKFNEALNDAEKTIELNPSWGKGYSRKGAALYGLEKYAEAINAYGQGLQIDPTNSSLIQGQLQAASKRNNINLNRQRQSSPPKQNTKSFDPSDNLPENKKLAKQEKDLGNEEYKKKEFEKALEHYNNAIAHDPNDITFYSNIAAVYFEQKDFDKCIKECEKAIEIGRENRADYKLIAKVLLRMGNSYNKLSDWKSAKIYYEKSMSEHRSPEVRVLINQMEKIIKEEERKAYIDPVKAEEEKEIGNELFKKGDFTTALKHYTEAIKRNPDDAKLYSNRAACYTKLAAFDLGLKDTEMCCKLDDKFIKGWIRRGNILQGMQQPMKAIVAYQKALELDENNAEALAGYRACAVNNYEHTDASRSKAANDPEIQAILKDPSMRLILNQMQNNPTAFQEHCKNPEITDKIYKLLEAGVIEFH